MTATVHPTPTTRARVVQAAVALTAEVGWAGVTMARIAERVGVSRQTVHHEVGTKQALAGAMISAELERFLAEVSQAFDAHPGDLVAALAGAARAVLELAQDNQLLHAVVSATHGADTELLPLLTTHADTLLDSATAVLVERVAPYGVDLPPERQRDLLDMVVRVVLSHAMAPSATPQATSEALGWLTGRVLAG